MFFDKCFSDKHIDLMKIRNGDEDEKLKHELIIAKRLRFIEWLHVASLESKELYLPLGKYLNILDSGCFINMNSQKYKECNEFAVAAKILLCVQTKREE